MIRNGDVELKAREEEIRFLKMEVTMKYLRVDRSFRYEAICMFLLVRDCQRV